MLSTSVWILLTCMKGNLICVRETPPVRMAYDEPQKSCYIDGVFYPRCADFNNSDVKYYHNLFKNK